MEQSDILLLLKQLVKSQAEGLSKQPFTVNITVNCDKTILINQGRYAMNPTDFTDAATAASFIAKTVAPYAVKKIVEGGLKEIGKDVYRDICRKAKSIWSGLKKAFVGETRLSATLEAYEKNPDSSEAQENLENDLTTRFRHHPNELTTLVEDLRELLKSLPETQRVVHTELQVTNAKDSNVTVIKGDGNAVTNIG